MLSARFIASFLRLHGWVLNLVFVALGAHFVAGAANAVVARSIRMIPTVDDMPVQATRVTSMERVPLVAVAERNLMALKREQLTPGGADQPAQPNKVPLLLRVHARVWLERPQAGAPTGSHHHPTEHPHRCGPRC